MSLLGSIISIGGMVLGGIIGSAVPGIGTSIGIALGAAIGGAIGGYVGNTLFPDTIDLNLPPPPKPYESRVQVSTYANPIPIVYESGRLAGNIIYMQPVTETIDRSSHRADGIRYYEYVKTYTSTFAIAFCEGPVEGICRIWVNGEVFADWRDPAGDYYPAGSTALASANLATSVARAAVYFSIYTGTQTQDADSALVAILGAAETPAYRGICYVVFREFPVGEFRGIPQIEVEIGPQMDATPDNNCSHYFDGTGSGLDSDFWGGEYSNWTRVDGVAYLTLNVPPPTWQITGNINPNYELGANSVIDITIDWTLENIISGLGEGGYFGIYFSGSGLPYIGLWWGEQQAADNRLSDDGVQIMGLDNDSNYIYFPTADRTGKFRLTRDASNVIRFYHWSYTNSRWEWNGDTGGIVYDADDSQLYLGIDASVLSASFDPSTLKIDNFIVYDGCEEAVWY